MKSVWAVEKGQYSDYRIVGVFSSEENAQKVCDLMNAEYGTNSYDSASVVCMPVDPAISELNAGLTQWYVSMKKDGEVNRAHQIDPTPTYIQGEMDGFSHGGRGQAELMTRLVWAKDRENAIKIVNEQRLQYLALNQWAYSK